jgi:hypothetical protein
MWLDISGYDSSGRRALYDSEKKCVIQIKTALEKEGIEVCANTIRNHKPPECQHVTRGTDLCPYCESARAIRARALKLDASTPRTEVMQQWGAADAATKNSLGASDQELLWVLEKHENLKQRLQQRFEDAIADMAADDAVAVCDYAANVPLTSVRGDSWEFFNVTTIALFGLQLFRPGGVTHTFYVVDFNTRVRKTALHAVRCVKTCWVAMEEMWPGTICNFELWSDTARSLRCGMYHASILQGGAEEFDTIATRHFAEYHGKTVLDQRFSCAKRVLGEIDAARLKSGQEDAKTRVKEALESLGSTTCHFLADSTLPKLKIRGCALWRTIHSIFRAEDGKFYVNWSTAEHKFMKITGVVEEEQSDSDDEGDQAAAAAGAGDFHDVVWRDGIARLNRQQQATKLSRKFQGGLLDDI